MLPDRRSLASPTVLALVGVLWVASVACGFAIQGRYALESGPAASGPRNWPQDVSITRDPHQPTLLVFAHPRCPCTRATLVELERIAHRCGSETSIVVLFFDPMLGESWTHGELWDRALAIPGVRVESDARGELARTFGVHTSGHALLFSRDGTLVFEGGITPTRGHVGDNAGEDAIVSWLETGALGCASTPARGCRLDACDAPVTRGAAP